MMLRKITVLLVCVIAAFALLTGCESDKKNFENKDEKSRVSASSAISVKPTENEDEPISEFSYKNQNN